MEKLTVRHAEGPRQFRSSRTVALAGDVPAIRERRRDRSRRSSALRLALVVEDEVVVDGEGAGHDGEARRGRWSRERRRHGDGGVR
jgi:hypothetical protein